MSANAFSPKNIASALSTNTIIRYLKFQSRNAPDFAIERLTSGFRCPHRQSQRSRHGQREAAGKTTPFVGSKRGRQSEHASAMVQGTCQVVIKDSIWGAFLLLGDVCQGHRQGKQRFEGPSALVPLGHLRSAPGARNHHPCWVGHCDWH